MGVFNIFKTPNEKKYAVGSHRPVNVIFANFTKNGVVSYAPPNLTKMNQIVAALNKVNVYKVTKYQTIHNIKQLLQVASKSGINTKKVYNKFRNKFNSVKNIKRDLPPGKTKYNKVTTLPGGTFHAVPI
jgi:hypothetical protein